MSMANWPGTFLPTLLGAVLLAVPARARADDSLPEVTRMVRELRYEEALARTEAVRRDASSTPLAKLRALELAALAQLGLGHEADARESFIRMLTLDPGAELTEERPSPRLVELFQSVRESLGGEEPRAGLLTTLSPAGTGLTAIARPDGEHAIVRVVFRAQVGGTQTDIAASRNGPPWRAEIPVPNRADLSRTSVVARGFAPSGRLAAVSPATRPDGDGTGTDPGVDDDTDTDPYRIRETPTEEGGGGLTSKWWFWGAVGAVVVGGTVTAIVLASSGGTEARQGDLGSLQLSPVPAE